MEWAAPHIVNALWPLLRLLTITSSHSYSARIRKTLRTSGNQPTSLRISAVASLSTTHSRALTGALWDICGKRANLPVYKLLGGKVRTAVPLYTHASAKELPELEDQVRKAMGAGYRH